MLFLYNNGLCKRLAMFDIYIQLFVAIHFASRYPVSGIGKGRSPDHKVKDGSMPGTKSLVVSRGDGVDYAYIFNSSNEIPRPGRVSIEQKINEFLHNKIIE
jgi:hypothetical protein